MLDYYIISIMNEALLDFTRTTGLLFVLLNPFLVIIYLVDIVQKLDLRRFSLILARAGLISTLVFCCFVLLGDAVFSYLVRAEFASFQIFGGVVFLIIGIQFVLKGNTAIEVLRGESDHLAGAIAMPILIGPGTISASVIVGNRLNTLPAILSIITAVWISISIMIVLKYIHDKVRPVKEPLIERYIEITGRITALFVGTVSVEMIMRGLKEWYKQF